METIFGQLGLWALLVYVLPGATFLLIMRYLVKTTIRSLLKIPGSVKEYVMTVTVATSILVIGMLLYSGWALVSPVLGVNSDPRIADGNASIYYAVALSERFEMSKLATTKTLGHLDPSKVVEIEDPHRIEMKRERQLMSRMALNFVAGPFATSTLRERDSKSMLLIVQARSEEGFVNSMGMLGIVVGIACILFGFAKLANKDLELSLEAGQYFAIVGLAIVHVWMCRETSISKGEWANKQIAGALLASTTQTPAK